MKKGVKIPIPRRLTGVRSGVDCSLVGQSGRSPDRHTGCVRIDPLLGDGGLGVSQVSGRRGEGVVTATSDFVASTTFSDGSRSWTQTGHDIIRRSPNPERSVCIYRKDAVCALAFTHSRWILPSLGLRLGLRE
jgi:hypothetical protein